MFKKDFFCSTDSDTILYLSYLLMSYDRVVGEQTQATNYQLHPRRSNKEDVEKT